MNDRSLDGMTVSERLYEFGLLAAFDRAAVQRDRAELIAILLRVKFSRQEAEQTVEALLADPKRYGW